MEKWSEKGRVARRKNSVDQLIIEKLNELEKNPKAVKALGDELVFLYHGLQEGRNPYEGFRKNGLLDGVKSSRFSFVAILALLFDFDAYLVVNNNNVCAIAEKAGPSRTKLYFVCDELNSDTKFPYSRT